ncbi:HNH endonuclease [Bifidobacterium magnum]|uniref:Putative phage protein gp2 n=1 Tax=Bifidobacterium magnum TaxID=1692 RepID=A0A087B680_9BIFI|nr:HNH endonuclease [Bifidobacterium magnum]KFI66530.1 putative phage protein gp2 [Bifidobacterium magnum]
MAWSSSQRKKRFNPGWAKIRAKILERDGHSCRWPVMDEFGLYHPCGAYANQVDHKQRDPVHDDDSSSNLWSLCDYHHAQKTWRESAEAKEKYRKRREDNEWYSHPAFGH